MKLCAARLSALFLTTGLFAAHAADWPGFLGPQGDGTSPETGLLDAFPAGGPTILWQTNIGTGYSAPSVRAGQLVLFHRLGDQEVVEAFDAATGKPRWRHGYPTAYIDPFGYNNGPRCAPLLTTNRCYTFGAEGKLTCLDLASGRQLWQRDTAKDFTVPEAFFGVGSAPLLEGNLLITMIGGQTNSGMVAFHAETGATGKRRGRQLDRSTDARLARRTDGELAKLGQAGQLFLARGRDDPRSPRGLLPDAPGIGGAGSGHRRGL